MDWIFNSFVSWVAKLVGDFLAAITTMFAGVLTCDLNSFNTIFDFAKTTQDIILGLGLSLLFTIVMFQLFRNLWGPLADKSVEHPVSIVIRAIIFFALTFFSKSIVEYILHLATVPYNLIYNTTVNTAGKQTWIDYIESSATTIGGGVSEVLGAVLTLFFLISIGWNYIKLLLEACERYIVVGIISYTAPLAVSTGCSKATDNIFKGWCRLVGSQVMLLIFNVWFLKLIESGMYNASTFMTSGIANANLAVWAAMVIAMEKAAMHMDSYMKSIIGNVAITGGGILDDMIASVGAVKSLFKGFKNAGASLSNMGSGGRGGSGTGSGTAGTLGAVAENLGRKFSASSFAADAAGSGGVRQSGGGTLGGALARVATGAAFSHSLDKGGNFATSTISRVAHGNGKKDYGTLMGDTASKSFAHFFAGSGASVADMQNTTIGDGVAQTQVGNDTNIRYFDSTKFRAPDAGTYTMEKAADGSNWYKQEFKSTDTDKPKAPERL